MARKYSPGDPVWYGNRDNPAKLDGRIAEVDAVHRDGSLTILVAQKPWQSKQIPGKPTPVVTPPPERIVVGKAAVEKHVWPRSNGAKVK